jgi:hypothetical protein
MRQKVKTYFLPVYIAKKGRQSLPFFGERRGAHFLTPPKLYFSWVVLGLKPGKAWLQTIWNQHRHRSAEGFPCLYSKKGQALPALFC